MAVPIAANATFQAGIPQPLFNVPAGNTQFQVTPDGQRFLIATAPQQTSTETPVTVVLNWPALLKK